MKLDAGCRLSKTMARPLRTTLSALLIAVLFRAGGDAVPPSTADLPEIIRRGTATIQSDWAADPDWAYVERDEVEKNGKKTSKTSQVVLMAGSDYNLPVATDDQPISADQRKMELQKLKNEYKRRNREDPDTRDRRIAKYKKQRDENGSLLLNFPHAFNFQLVGEEPKDGHPAFMLTGDPKKRSGPLSRAAKVLAGMNGTVWIDQEGFHAIRAECSVTAPVPIYGILARVLPGTKIILEFSPVSSSVWLVNRFSMNLTVSKLGFRSTEITNTTYSDYRPNDVALQELLSEADRP